MVEGEEVGGGGGGVRRDAGVVVNDDVEHEVHPTVVERAALRSAAELKRVVSVSMSRDSICADKHQRRAGRGRDSTPMIAVPIRQRSRPWARSTRRRSSCP